MSEEPEDRPTLATQAARRLLELDALGVRMSMAQTDEYFLLVPILARAWLEMKR